jgi:sialidase-1
MAVVLGTTLSVAGPVCVCHGENNAAAKDVQQSGGARKVSPAVLETVDVLLPGRGETLLQAPKYDWERIGTVQGWFYRNTRGTGEIRIRLKGASGQDQALIHGTNNVAIPGNSLWSHDFQGYFGVHTPGLIVTSKGTAVAIGIRRHDSMSDGGNHDGDILSARSDDDGKTWSRQQVIFEETGMLIYLGAIVEDRTTGTILVSFWKIPNGVQVDTGYFKTHAAQGGGFFLLKSTDEGETWSKPISIDPALNDDGWMAWNNNCVHGIQLVGGTHAGRLIIPSFHFKADEPGYVQGIRGGLLISDDHGKTWLPGAVLKEDSDEVSLVQTGDDELYISHRMNSRTTGRRHFARSRDGGETLSEEGEHSDLACRGLHAGLIKLPG